MTDAAIEAAKHFAGSPADRILGLMEAVTFGNLARYDLPIWHWAQSDDAANSVFRRTLQKRFSFAAWMFSEAGFASEQAEIRGRMMVTYLMAESTLIPGSLTSRKDALKLQHAVLLAPEP